MKSATKIIAITRGGLLPALLLSYKYEIKKIDTIGISSYQGKKQGTLKIEDKDFSFIQGEVILLCDDLCDTGTTMKAAVNYLKKYNPAKIITYAGIVKPSSIFTPNYYERKAEDNEWIDFTYENEFDFSRYVRVI